MNLKKIKTEGSLFHSIRVIFRILQRCNTSKNDESHRGGEYGKSLEQKPNMRLKNPSYFVIKD